jgi:dCTP deaminase
MRHLRWDNAGIEITIDPALVGFDHDAFVEQVTERHTIPSEGYALVPGNLVLGWSAEYVDLRNDARLAARVAGKVLWVA